MIKQEFNPIESKENLIRIAKKYGCNPDQFLSEFNYEEIHIKNNDKVFNYAFELTGNKKNAISLINLCITLNNYLIN